MLDDVISKQQTGMQLQRRIWGPKCCLQSLQCRLLMRTIHTTPGTCQQALENKKTYN
jgi:hypothetical protein